MIGILLYYGGKKWDVSNSFQESLGFSEETLEKFGEFIPEFKYIAIKVREDNLIEDVREMRIKSFLCILLISDSKNVYEDFLMFLRVSLSLHNSEDDLQFFDTLLGYGLLVFSGDLAILAKKVGEEMGAYMENLIMTGGERFHQELLDMGRAEGRAEGREEGREEEREDIARNLIRSGCSEEMLLKATGFSVKQLHELGLKQT